MYNLHTLNDKDMQLLITEYLASKPRPADSFFVYVMMQCVPDFTVPDFSLVSANLQTCMRKITVAREVLPVEEMNKCVASFYEQIALVQLIKYLHSDVATTKCYFETLADNVPVHFKTAPPEVLATNYTVVLRFIKSYLEDNKDAFDALHDKYDQLDIANPEGFNKQPLTLDLEVFKQYLSFRDTHLTGIKKPVAKIPSKADVEKLSQEIADEIATRSASSSSAATSTHGRGSSEVPNEVFAKKSASKKARESQPEPLQIMPGISQAGLAKIVAVFTNTLDIGSRKRRRKSD